jgi:hypothetical protein
MINYVTYFGFTTESIHALVWSGFYDQNEVHEMLGSMIEDPAAEPMLREAIDREFASKAIDEASWPTLTDCDRLDAAFDDLYDRGVIAMHCAGFTLSEGDANARDAREELGEDDFFGFCFYHEQDVKSALESRGIYLAFDSFDDDSAARAKVGRVVKEALEAHGFKVTWNGDPGTRLIIPDFDWKQRLVS